MPNGDRTKQLEGKARWVWEQTLLVHRRAPETRVASSLSCIEVLVALFYGGVLQHDPANQYWQGRDRLIVSKGHGSIALYPILADRGYFDLSELENVCQPGSFLGGIPDALVPGIETVNGSLGHGLGVSAGVALALQRRATEESVFVLLGDGELHEGSNWEAVMFAAHHRLDNLVAIVDNNRVSMLGPTRTIVDHSPLAQRFGAFDWQTTEVDGHDIDQVQTALEAARENRGDRPKVVVCNTVKGHGVPELEEADLAHVMVVSADRIDELLADV